MANNQHPLAPPRGPQPDLMAAFHDAASRFSGLMPKADAINMAIAMAACKSVEGLAGHLSASYTAPSLVNASKTIAERTA